MAESHEPSYYEIALTNGQVIVAFVILLVCLLSAFFSGVWIGREGFAQAQERLASNLGGQPAAPVSEEGRQIQELEFFDSDSREEAAGPEQDQVEPPPPDQPVSNDTTLLEDFAGEEPRIETQPVPEEEPEAAPADAAPAKAPEETRAERRQRLAREREERQERAAAAAEPEPAATPVRASREAEPKVPKGSVVIQVFSSPDQEQAERIRDRLAKGGYKAYLSPVETGGRTMFRVRIGPYGSRSDADTAAENVRKTYKLDTWVTE